RAFSRAHQDDWLALKLPVPVHLGSSVVFHGAADAPVAHHGCLFAAERHAVAGLEHWTEVVFNVLPHCSSLSSLAILSFSPWISCSSRSLAFMASIAARRCG